MKFFRFELTNKYIYWSLIFLSLAILTSINNYYFFKNVLVNSHRNGLQLKNILETQIIFCRENNFSTKICQENIVQIAKAFLKKDYYNKSLTIKNSANEILLENKASRNYPASSSIEIIINNENNNLNMLFYLESKFNVYEFSQSVINSMTFSFSDLVNIIYLNGIQNAVNEFANHYWPRSRPFFGFLIFTVALFSISRFREKMLITKQEELEKRIIQTFQENEVLRLQRENASENSYETLGEKIKSFDKHINPPINTINIDLLFLDLHSLANKCRQIAEKLVFEKNEKYFKVAPKNLFEGIKNLYNKKLITQEMYSNLEIIRAYGNTCSHYNKGAVITRSEGIALCACLISILEEFYSDREEVYSDISEACINEKLSNKVNLLLRKFSFK